MGTRMFYDTPEETIRTRIRKFRDPKANDRYRLEQATVLVDLVDRMLEAAKHLPQDEPEEVQENPPAVQPEELVAATDSEGNEVTADSLGLNDPDPSESDNPEDSTEE